MADIDSRAGKTYQTPAILDYLAHVHAPHDEALEHAFTAPGRTGLPAIQVGPSEGRLLCLLAMLIGAKNVIEIGTLAGYSAIWLARALPEDGKLYTLENDAHAASVARESFERAGISHKVTIMLGDATASLEKLEALAPFCMVFVDADKGRYDVYGRFARKHLRPGGLLVGDNAYFFGDLLEEGNASASAMRRFHEEMAEGFDSVCVPTPDGLAVGRKRA